MKVRAFEEIGLLFVLNGTMYKLAARFTDSRIGATNVNPPTPSQSRFFRPMSFWRSFLPAALLLGSRSMPPAESDPPVDVALARTMSTMHKAMYARQPTGIPDVDFARLMIPHQGAIYMAKVELVFRTDARCAG
jgi:hypothetical protein